MFEVRATDLAGRLGRLEVSGRSMQTPAYLPVVHPIRQQVPVSVLKGMGFEAIMTNSYITMKHFPQGVDIHKQVGFDGIIMTDSGGYQVLEYGDVDASPVQVAEFQIKIGTDIAVILDRPTGYPSSRIHADETVQDTLAASRKCVEQIAHKPPLWAGPIQGGTFGDLVRFSARRMSEMDFDVFAIGSPVELMNGYRFREVVRLVTEAKSVLPVENPVHLFGAGHPFMIPLAVALGCDLFDSASYILFAKQGKYMTPSAIRDVHELEELPCPCPVCSSTSTTELRQMTQVELTAKLAVHNLHIMKSELASTREALREGRLWGYMVQRMKSHPYLATALKFEKNTLKLFDSGLRWGKDKATFFFDETDLMNPEVRRHIRKMDINFSARHRTLSVLLAGREFDVVFVHSARIISKAEERNEDVVFFHPFLSVVPVTAVSLHPLAQNVCIEEPSREVLFSSVNRLAGFIKKNGYKKVMIRPGKGRRRQGTELKALLEKAGVRSSLSRSGW